MSNFDRILTTHLDEFRRLGGEAAVTEAEILSCHLQAAAAVWMMSIPARGQANVGDLISKIGFAVACTVECISVNIASAARRDMTQVMGIIMDRLNWSAKRRLDSLASEGLPDGMVVNASGAAEPFDFRQILKGEGQ